MLSSLCKGDYNTHKKGVATIDKKIKITIDRYIYKYKDIGEHVKSTTN